MPDITIRWAGPADAASGSTYKVEQTLDNVNWTVLAAAQAATAPYVSDSTTLAQNASHGATALDLADAAAFAASGYAWLDDALVQWAGKTGNQLTGVTWHSGYGTYAAGTAIYEAHESYADAGVTISLNAVVYRITHTDAGGNLSAPAYLWYYSPPLPASSDHCVVVVNLHTDLGVEAQSGVNVEAYLKLDTVFGVQYGAHLDAGQSSDRVQVTNAFGLAFFHCFRSTRRNSLTLGGDVSYEFVLDSAGGSDALTVQVETVPVRDWILLSDVASLAA